MTRKNSNKLDQIHPPSTPNLERSEINLSSNKLIQNDTDDCIVVYEFKIEGMTCVACSSSIERGLTKKY